MQFLAASAPSSAAPRLQLSARLSRPRPFAHLRRRCAPHLPSKPLPLASVSRVLLPRARRSLAFTPRAHSNHHGHGHGHCHCHHGANVHGGGGGATVMRLARAIGWADVADALRDHLQACCISLGLLLIAAACPHVAPLNSVGRLQAALIAVAFPLVGATNNENKLSTAAIGSVEYISSLYRSNGECEQVQEAIKSSAYGPEFVQAALLMDKKIFLFMFDGSIHV
ncbi:probable cadmium/zinc-transporting ATPase HMA1, chloroplastic [Triticum aestivum]|uniref:probable cadmium/zinc-transporting ATPase HMA1, chloroplastic n=1 Tax=Triticum aestivum TaxID=4565 RepID=UPI001D0091E6|nr:probable cadmium/zinc-transporting ATPase HMA1, chloroplastic [Triticum aestivum]